MLKSEPTWASLPTTQHRDKSLETERNGTKLREKVKYVYVDERASSYSLFFKEISIWSPLTWCLDNVLKMDSYFIQVILKPIKEYKHAVGLFMAPHTIIIDSDSIRKSKVLRRKYKDPQLLLFKIIFHECRHYYQYQTGMFETPRDQKLKENIRGLDHYSKRIWESLPWEKDAKKFCEKTFERWIDERQW